MEKNQHWTTHVQYFEETKGDGITAAQAEAMQLNRTYREVNTAERIVTLKKYYVPSNQLTLFK